MAEGDGLLNRYRTSSSIEGSNPFPSLVCSKYSAAYRADTEWLRHSLPHVWRAEVRFGAARFPSAL